MKQRNALKALSMALCAALLVCGLIFAPLPARAAGTVTVSKLTVTPTSLPAAGGTVTLKVTLKNDSGADIDSIRLKVVSFEKEIDMAASNVFKAGDSREFTMENVPMASTDIGRAMTLDIVWTTGHSYETFTVSQVAETVSLSFTRTVNNQTVQKGDSVKLTYNLKNTGTAAITGLELTDSCVDGVILSGAALAPGESRQVTSTIKVNAAVTSQPKAVYTAGGTSRTKTLEGLNITVSNPRLSITATASKATVNAGEKVTFTIVVKNESAVAVSGIKITDEAGTVIKSGASIAATTGSTAKTLSVTHEATMNTSRAASFTVTYQSGGETATDTTDPVSVSVLGSTPGVSPLTITATVSPVAMTFPGEVTFTITVMNTSAQAVSNIVVTEPTLGAIGNILSLSAGGQQQLTKTMTLNAPATFTFSATGNDLLAQAIEPGVGTVAVTEQLGTQTPDVVAPQPGDTLGTLFWVMIVIIVLIIIAGITLLILSIQEKRKKAGGGGGKRKRGRGDYEDEEWDYDDLLDEPQDEPNPFDNQAQDRIGRRIEQTEMTQPILRSTIAAATQAGHRRAYGPEEGQGVREEYDPAQEMGDEDGYDAPVTPPVYGPAPEEEPWPPAQMRRPSFEQEERLERGASHPQTERELPPLRARSTMREQDFLEPRDERVQRRTRAHLQDENAPQAPPRPRYENEEEDLPPRRPRRR